MGKLGDVCEDIWHVPIHVVSFLDGFLDKPEPRAATPQLLRESDLVPLDYNRISTQSETGV